MDAGTACDELQRSVAGCSAPCLTLRVAVVECEGLLVLVHDVGRDLMTSDLAEDGVLLVLRRLSALLHARHERRGAAVKGSNRE